jgi:membrane-associated phospholipid phosphatase
VNRTIAPEAQPILPPAVRRPLAFVGVPAALVVIVLAVLLFDDHSGTALDRRLDPRLERMVLATEPFGKIVDFAGEPVGLVSLIVLLVVLSLLRHRPRVAALAVLGTGLTITVTSTFKPLVGRTIHEVYLSYPSGHTASATALAMIAVMLFWHRLSTGAALALLYGVAFAVGLLAAWAQAGLTAHYATDTVGGWCTALAVVPATAWLIDRTAAWWSVRQARQA